MKHQGLLAGLLLAGCICAGAASLFQFFMWDDATPQYQFSCRLKSTGARGCVFMASPPCNTDWIHPSAFLVPPFLYAQDHPQNTTTKHNKTLWT
jgi:hypothetical protein